MGLAMKRKRDFTKITESVYKRLLGEEVPDLGNVQFSPQRVDGARTDEPNTDDEKRLRYDLQAWIKYNSLPTSAAEQIRNLIKSPKYKNFFHTIESDSVPLYRGMTLTSSQLYKYLGIDETSELPDTGKRKLAINLKNLNNANVSSWTRDLETAQDFADMNVSKIQQGNAFEVVFTTLPSENIGVFLDLQDIKKKVKGFSYANEDEILALDAVKTTEIMWTTDKEGWSSKNKLSPTSSGKLPPPLPKSKLGPTSSGKYPPPLPPSKK